MLIFTTRIYMKPMVKTFFGLFHYNPLVSVFLIEIFEFRYNHAKEAKEFKKIHLATLNLRYF
ncbi:hypothetical protein DN752_12990 [Echinicola strongylocentroti]|uniref:Uncharacterized protein n=1 Tax=Echinicola strongylocentroti TaxID=1795355 RepID=A0A2Z4IKA5_9BACT|nr:hypothetical protein DN752_12990 [Echinicola strongylocentroti]